MWCRTALVCLWVGWALGYRLQGELAELAHALRDACAQESGVERALLERVDAGAALAPDARLKCYLKCVMETGGMLDAGRVELDALLDMLPPELAAAVGDTMRACGTQQGADDCDTAYRTQLCWQTNNRQHYFLV